MKKIHIIITLAIGCLIVSLLLQFIEMNLTLRTILVTILIAILFTIRAVIAMHQDKASPQKKQ